MPDQTLIFFFPLRNLSSNARTHKTSDRRSFWEKPYLFFPPRFVHRAGLFQLVMRFALVLISTVQYCIMYGQCIVGPVPTLPPLFAFGQLAAV